ncbi:Eukaryotic translation initiation factor 2A [Fasciola hepatica]|uniref:Eukaryotic translation initiation factor 2A n=1 Tax=Fasciola hepatica TaxID=6192 RepID=A0A4E0QYA5_FASHE|nr:Eukaryotic translation initiation factor 2A [Fasciola hepatica]
MFSCVGSDGVKIYQFDGKNTVRVIHSIPSNESMVIKKALVNEHGKLFLLNNDGVDFLDLNNFVCSRIIETDALRLSTSPCGKVVFVFRNFVAPSGDEKIVPNVSVVDTESKAILKEYMHRAVNGWQPQWNSDSSVCALHWNGEIQFYLNNEFGEKPAARLAVKGMQHFSLSPNSNTPNIAVYIPPQKDQPANVRLFQLRNGQCVAVTNKSFYRADTVRLVWNDSGTDLLVLTSTKVSDESYYGEQCLHYLTTIQSRDTANVVMPRKGPIHQVAWRPTGATMKGKSSGSQNLFVVCYGFMPASVTVFGTNCEPVFDFGTGSWNQIYFNPHGNLLLLAGLGSLTGDMSVWNFNQYEKLSTFKTTDVTSVSWFNDGEHLLLSTTAPRMRVNNGFGIWHYSGNQVLYQNVAPRAVPRPATFDLPAVTEHELYDVQVVPQYPLPPVPKPKKFDPVPAKTAASEANPSSSGGVYVPPALRNRSAVAKQAVAVANAVGSKPVTKMNIPVGLDPELYNNSKQKKQKKPQKSADQSSTVPSNQPCQVGTGDNGKAKQRSQLRKKLAQIEKLKVDQASGKQLDPNQIEKVASEAQLRTQLAELSLSS